MNNKPYVPTDNGEVVLPPAAPQEDIYAEVARGMRLGVSNQQLPAVKDGLVVAAERPESAAAIARAVRRADFHVGDEDTGYPTESWLAAFVAALDLLGYQVVRRMV